VYRSFFLLTDLITLFSYKKKVDYPFFRATISLTPNKFPYKRTLLTDDHVRTIIRAVNKAVST
jgi:hypothetical protein